MGKRERMEGFKEKEDQWSERKGRKEEGDMK